MMIEDNRIIDDNNDDGDGIESPLLVTKRTMLTMLCLLPGVRVTKMVGESAARQPA